jgi:drug/metabolite transporter (DMT)-like permease
MPKHSRAGPWLVALGAALWGTESYWRIPLAKAFASDVIVFHEHVILVALLFPLVIARWEELRRVSRRSLGFLIFSGIAGSAVGTIFFTEALRYGNTSVTNVVLNVQPVLSTTAAVLVFGDRLSKSFFVWAPLAILAGAVLVIEDPATLALHPGIGYALLCALFWGLSTVAGRGAMTGMSLGLASGLRVIVGLITMTIVLAARGKLGAADLWPEAATTTELWQLLGLATLSGGVPLFFYFAGLARTKASTAGYFEMMQTLAALVVTWGIKGDALKLHQMIAGALLIFFVAMVQRAQEPYERLT